MPYRREKFGKGCTYHVYNRGFERRLIFQDTDDYTRFQNKLGNYVGNLRFGLHAYCLMPNHYHLLLEQKGSDGLDVLIGVTIQE